MPSSGYIGARDREIVSGGLDESFGDFQISRSRSYLSFSVEQMYSILVQRYDAETPSESITVKSAWYGKQTKGAQHEFIIVKVEDIHVPGRINYLALDRNTDAQRYSWGVSLAKDTFRISLESNMEKLLRGCNLNPCVFLDEMLFQSDAPLHLYELATLANIVSGRYPAYRLLNSSCYLFAGVIWKCMRLVRPSAVYTDASARHRGKYRVFRFFPSASKILETYQEFVEKLLAVNMELQKHKKARVNSLASAQSFGPQKHTKKAEIETVSSEMSALQMFHSLVGHGCVDLSSHMDFDNSASASAGGSFGDIWQGRIDGKIDVAIKVLRFQTIVERHKKGLKRVMRETYIWSKVVHPNVQPLMGIVMHQDRLGMVSLWMENGNLQQYIKRNPNVDRYRLCRGVAAGVAYLHDDVDMVHGDIKALNILVSHDGVPKLSDFDHSILSESTLAFSATTNLGGGTLRWMAPELLLSSDEEGSPPATRTKQTDVYALGMTILETVTGEVPYSEYRNDMGIYRALDKRKSPNRPQQLLDSNERVDQTWELLLKCWNHDPACRPDASLVLGSLESFSIE